MKEQGRQTDRQTKGRYTIERIIKAEATDIERRSSINNDRVTSIGTAAADDLSINCIRTTWYYRKRNSE